MSFVLRRIFQFQHSNNHTPLHSLENQTMGSVAYLHWKKNSRSRTVKTHSRHLRCRLCRFESLDPRVTLTFLFENGDYEHRGIISTKFDVSTSFRSGFMGRTWQTDGRTDGHLHTMQPAPYDRRTEILQYVAIEHKWVIHRKYTVKIHTTW